MATPEATMPALLQCDICLNEVPLSVGDHAEADEYVYYYFGLECYQRWCRSQSQYENSTSANDSLDETR